MTETIDVDPIFMKALIKYHTLQKKARTRVTNERLFFEYTTKVFKWQRKIRKQIKSSIPNLQSNVDETTQPPVESNSLESVRKNIWLLIVRKDIVQGYKRKVQHNEQRIQRTKVLNSSISQLALRAGQIEREKEADTTTTTNSINKDNKET